MPPKISDHLGQCMNCWRPPDPALVIPSSASSETKRFPCLGIDQNFISTRFLQQIHKMRQEFAGCLQVVTPFPIKFTRRVWPVLSKGPSIGPTTKLVNAAQQIL